MTLKTVDQIWIFVLALLLSALAQQKRNLVFSGLKHPIAIWLKSQRLCKKVKSVSVP